MAKHICDLCLCIPPKLECGGRSPRCTARETHAWSGSIFARLCLCYATPISPKLFAKFDAFLRQRCTWGRHSELLICARDSMFVSLSTLILSSFARQAPMAQKSSMKHPTGHLSACLALKKSFPSAYWRFGGSFGGTRKSVLPCVV